MDEGIKLIYRFFSNNVGCEIGDDGVYRSNTSILIINPLFGDGKEKEYKCWSYEDF